MKRRGGMAVAAVMLAWATHAAGSEASTIELELSSQRPGTSTAMKLHIHYTKRGDPNAKPSPIRRIQIDAPAGTEFHSSRVPRCDASDAEVRALGPRACPRQSQIGDGTVVVVTGFGKPFDPFSSPTPVFNDGKGWLEISQTPSAPTTIAVTRLTVTGSRISGPIGAAPGGPPDYQTAVSTVDLTFPRSTGYITTPRTCPSTGRWVTTGTFTFADGSTEVVRDSMPCARSGAGDARLGLRLSGRRSRAGGRSCFRGRVRATLTGRDRHRARSAVFFVGRTRVARDGRRPLSKIVDRWRHRGASHRHVARASVRMADGSRVRLRKRYRVCGGRRASGRRAAR